jgi:L-lactate utilization protein LutB
MACHDVCPKGLPLLEVYAFLRRKMFAKMMTPLAREVESSKRESSKM